MADAKKAVVPAGAAAFTGPTIHLNPKLPNVPLYTKQEFDKRPNGREQTILRIAVRPVTENERFSSVKAAAEAVLQQQLYHMGLVDVKNERVYHYNDPIGGGGNNSGAAAASVAVSASASASASRERGGSNSAAAAAAVSVSAPVAVAQPVRPKSATPPAANPTPPGGAALSIVATLPPLPASNPHTPAATAAADSSANTTANTTATASATATATAGVVSSAVAWLLPTQLQSDKQAARWVSATIPEFVGTRPFPGGEVLYVDIPLTQQQQTIALERAIQMAETYKIVSADEIPAYDALKWNCQHMCFHMFGGEWDAFSGQADMVVTRAVQAGQSVVQAGGEAVEWVKENPKTTAIGVAAGVVVGLLLSWMTAAPPPAGSKLSNAKVTELPAPAAVAGSANGAAKAQPIVKK